MVALTSHDLRSARAILPAWWPGSGRWTPGTSPAVIESVAENILRCGGGAAAVGALAGLPGLLAYRAVNTLDAMVGHRSLGICGSAGPRRLGRTCQLAAGPVTAALTALRPAPHRAARPPHRARRAFPHGPRAASRRHPRGGAARVRPRRRPATQPNAGQCEGRLPRCAEYPRLAAPTPTRRRRTGPERGQGRPRSLRISAGRSSCPGRSPRRDRPGLSSSPSPVLSDTHGAPLLGDRIRPVPVTTLRAADLTPRGPPGPQ